MTDLKINPVLCETTRSNLVEIIHRGACCCTRIDPDQNGSVLFSSGNIDHLFYPRSAMKFVQVLPLIESGAAEAFGFTDTELAVMCASHNGEPGHLETVRSILNKIGLHESDLACGGHSPCEVAAFDYIREGAATPFTGHIYNNCSGKHAGFLAMCKHEGFSIDGYLKVDHPLQQRILDVICDLFGLEKSSLHIGVDGCSAPTVAVTARQAALGYARLCQAQHLHENRARGTAIATMLRAVVAHPWMVYGTEGFCTELLRCGQGGVIGKRGAAGVYMCGLVGKGVGCAVKIDDGAMGPQYAVTMEMLHKIFRLQSEENAEEEPRGGRGGRAEECTVDKSESTRGGEGGNNNKQWLEELERFRVIPSVNSMGVHVGYTSCVQDLWT